MSPWLSPARKFGKELYFSNLKDGQSVESPFVARFGASNVGIVPAGKTVGSHGHLHLLIDTPLPVDLTLPPKNVPLAECFNSDKENADDED
ncbi:hypothetical protein QN413_27020, partial [Variovorax sp. LG9.2]|nr:hypothetical protein [Variovorax sp. LG9.2]